MSLKTIIKNIDIASVTSYVQKQSDPQAKRFVFSYTVTISNNSEQAVQLLSRHWVIQNAEGKIEEVYGEGVIGQQPVIEPGRNYVYSSGAVLETEMGTMEGRYFMVTKSVEDGNKEFEVPIPKFVLTVPRTLH